MSTCTRSRPWAAPNGLPPHLSRLRLFATPEGGDPTPTPPAPTPAPPAAPAPAPAAPAQEPTDWKAEARKWEERAKENKTAAEKLAALEESQKTEAQKLADRATAAEAKAAGYERKEQISAWKTEVEKTSGVPAAALAGSTLEEIQAHAETLKPLIAKPEAPVDDGKPHIPYRELSKPQAEAPAPTRGTGTLRAAYAAAATKK